MIFKPFRTECGSVCYSVSVDEKSSSIGQLVESQDVFWFLPTRIVMISSGMIHEILTKLSELNGMLVDKP